jgi:heme-degrading monooxygenase HmoA
VALDAAFFSAPVAAEGSASTLAKVNVAWSLQLAAWSMRRRQEWIPMIARLWHGKTSASRADEYLEYLRRTGIPDYRSTPGNRGVQILLRREADVAQFLLITQWDSWEAIRAFAGSDVDRARYYPEDADFLLELEPDVIHYEVVEG